MQNKKKTKKKEIWKPNEKPVKENPTWAGPFRYQCCWRGLAVIWAYLGPFTLSELDVWALCYFILGLFAKLSLSPVTWRWGPGNRQAADAHQRSTHHPPRHMPPAVFYAQRKENAAHCLVSCCYGHPSRSPSKSISVIFLKNTVIIEEHLLVTLVYFGLGNKSYFGASPYKICDAAQRGSIIDWKTSHTLVPSITWPIKNSYSALFFTWEEDGHWSVE